MGQIVSRLKKSNHINTVFIAEIRCKFCNHTFRLIISGSNSPKFKAREIEYWNTSFLLHKVAHINEIIYKSISKKGE